jgi:hypothetical protein
MLSVEGRRGKQMVEGVVQGAWCVCAFSISPPELGREEVERRKTRGD